MQNFAGTIDHTILKPDATSEDVKKLCEEAKSYSFASVCVNPCHVALAARLLHGSGVAVCTVIGFPLGAATTATKMFETNDAIENGASEIDMVINIGAVKDKNYITVENDIAHVKKEIAGRALLKVIIETCLLTDEEKIRVCECCVSAKADFVKTSTGFSTGGATVDDIKLMRKTVGDKARIKASGGIRTRGAAEEMLAAGADRIGCSQGAAFMRE